MFHKHVLFLAVRCHSQWYFSYLAKGHSRPDSKFWPASRPACHRQLVFSSVQPTVTRVRTLEDVFDLLTIWWYTLSWYGNSLTQTHNLSITSPERYQLHIMAWRTYEGTRKDKHHHSFDNIVYFTTAKASKTASHNMNTQYKRHIIKIHTD